MKCLMKTTLVIAGLTFACGIAGAKTSESTSFTSSQLKQMICDAHTPQQYQALADYYRWRQQDFEQKAKSEKVEWDRRWQILTGGAMEKYPRPVDSSRNRYEYFNFEAQRMSRQAEYFESLSMSAAH